MFDTINSYIQACLKCQQFRPKTDKLRPFHMRIPDEYRPFDRISLDFKTMPTSYTGFKHLMVVCCEITRFVKCIPLKSLAAEIIAEALIQQIITLFGPPSVIVTDAASALTGKLLETLCATLHIDHKVISVENHGSLHVERMIKTISNFIKTNLNQLGTDWVRYISTSTWAYNSFASPHLGGYSPYELLFLREPPNMANLNFKPVTSLSSSYDEYLEHLKQKFNHVSKTMLDLQANKQESQNVKISNKLVKNPTYSVGQLVYLFKPTSSRLTANSRKIGANWVGPIVIHQVLDRTHFVLATLEGKILNDVFNFNRLKPCLIHASNESQNISNVQKLKQVLAKDDLPQDNKAERQSIRFTDEHGEQLPLFKSEQMVCLRETNPVDFTPYLVHASENHGIAIPKAVSEKEIMCTLDLLNKAPRTDHFNFLKSRFKAGRLQLLLSFKNGKNEDCRFWFDVENDPESLELANFALSDTRLPCVGSPEKLLNYMYCCI